MTISSHPLYSDEYPKNILSPVPQRKPEVLKIHIVKNRTFLRHMQSKRIESARFVGKSDDAAYT